MLFASQGAQVVSQITSVLRVCAPLVVYFLVVFSATVYACWKFGFGYKVSCTQSFTAASNNFELAIAVVVAVYGAGSGQALASTVGPLIEVPVLVGLVYVIKWVKKRWEWMGYIITNRPTAAPRRQRSTPHSPRLLKGRVRYQLGR